MLNLGICHGMNISFIILFQNMIGPTVSPEGINLHSWTAVEKIKYKNFLQSDVWTDQAERKYITWL